MLEPNSEEDPAAVVHRQEAIKAERDAAVLQALLFLLNGPGFGGSMNSAEKEYLQKVFSFYGRKKHLEAGQIATLVSEIEEYRKSQNLRQGLPAPERIMQILISKTTQLALPEHTIGFYAYHLLDKVEIPSSIPQRLRNIFRLIFVN